MYNIDGKINFIIGTDAFEKIESWYEAEKLQNLVDFIVFVRENEPVNFDYLKAKGYSFKFAKMNFTDISSTELRRRISHNEPINDMVTKEVEDYIRKNGLYRN
jgi:nicotinate-nucleotide adenylyltransferase